jgi:hypothetical protein
LTAARASAVALSEDLCEQFEVFRFFYADERRELAWNGDVSDAIRRLAEDLYAITDNTGDESTPPLEAWASYVRVLLQDYLRTTFFGVDNLGNKHFAWSRDGDPPLSYMSPKKDEPESERRTVEWRPATRSDVAEANRVADLVDNAVDPESKNRFVPRPHSKPPIFDSGALLAAYGLWRLDEAWASSPEGADLLEAATVAGQLLSSASQRQGGRDGTEPGLARYAATVRWADVNAIKERIREEYRRGGYTNKSAFAKRVKERVIEEGKAAEKKKVFVEGNVVRTITGWLKGL